ncbi:MAG TPA: bifunctional phosphoribosyl-AMP cyclohydrolase/phosphoribosyl-ATP diphosphatase HisIE [Acidobacteriota bacterium]|nr:bifunctional phosphoribosyl-AMP cyclohydrolase/phosphoribosyl-ATP diphosphatase HisIE [Acidobacteriota bacterium]
MHIRTVDQIDAIDFQKGAGLVPVVVQDALTGTLLMLAYADREAVERTLTSGQMHFHSRSRQELWHKGSTSGNVQELVSLQADCDADTLLARVRPAGPACHTGERSCFSGVPTLVELDDVIADRARSGASNSYTAGLLADPNVASKKLGEESVELAVAISQGCREEIAGEAADLLYHTLVACRGAGVALGDVLAELARRRRSSD